MARDRADARSFEEVYRFAREMDFCFFEREDDTMKRISVIIDNQHKEWEANC